MADEQELYDEFGNYIGPELDSSDEGESDDEESNSEDESNDNDNRSSGASSTSSISIQGEEENNDRNEDVNMDVEDVDMSGTPSNAIVLHEDKVHYPSASTVYGENVQTITLDEDTMDLDTPIIEPVKTKHFSLVSESATFRTKKSRGGKPLGHKTDLDGTSPAESTPNEMDPNNSHPIPDQNETQPLTDIVSAEYLTLLLSNENKRHSPRRSLVLFGNLHSGKTTFCDSLLENTFTQPDAFGPRASFEAQHQNLESGGGSGAFPRITDVLLSEQDRGLSIKSTPCTIPLPDTRGKTHLITLMDTPGHANFHDEVVSSLVLADGAMICVDALEGVGFSTTMGLKAAIREGLPLLLLINKMDRLILELRLPPQDTYYKLRQIVEQLNNLIYEYSFGRYGNNYFKPAGKEGGKGHLGNVVFASSVHGWSFTLSQLSNLYSDFYDNGDDKGLGPNHFSINELTHKMWGDTYFDPETRQFQKNLKSSSLKRTFIEFALEPIYKIYASCLGESEEKVDEMLRSVGVYLTQTQLQSSARVLTRAAFKRFFGDSGGFVDTVMSNIPTPAIAARAKVSRCFTGALDSTIARSMMSCDARAPLMIHITKLYAAPDGQSFSAFGRIYSGTIKPGDKVKILGEAYTPQDDEDMSFGTVTTVSIPRGRRRTEVTMAKAGNWVLLDGIDATIAKTATITNAEGTTVPQEDLCIFKSLKFPEAGEEAVVKLAVEPLNPAELPKMVEGLRRISKSYPMAKTKVEESGEHVLYGTGELYLDCAMHDLRHMFSDIEVKVADPVVAFRETVAETSSIKCFAETTNKRNKLTVIAEPLDDGLAEKLETGKVDLNWDKKKVGRFFQTKYSWDILSSRSVWAFGPTPNDGPNILLDDSLPSETSKDLLFSVKSSIIQGFQWATREGPLCEEPVRSTKIKILDATLADKPIHRGGGQIIPTARRVVHSAFLTGVPRLMEPIYNIQIVCPPDIISPLQPLLSRRRGHMVSSAPMSGSPLSVVKAFLPIIDSFGFETDIRTFSQGQAMVNSVFDHWAIVPGDPMDKSIILHPLEPSPPMALAREFLVKTRRRKGLSEDVSITKFLDEGMRAKLLELTEDESIVNDED